MLTGADGSYAFDRLAPGDWVVAPMLGGGGLRPKDMFYARVTLTAGQATRADVLIEDGSASANVRVVDVHGAPRQSLLYVVPGTVQASTSESLLDGAWLGSDAITPQYFRLFTSDPVTVDAMKPGTYTFCAMPLSMDLDNPVAMRALRDTVATLPITCSTSNVTGQGVAVTVLSK